MDGLKMRTGKYFEVSAKVTKTQEDGEEKRVKETVVVEAESFGDAEEKALTEYDGYDVDIVSVKHSAIQGGALFKGWERRQVLQGEGRVHIARRENRQGATHEGCVSRSGKLFKQSARLHRQGYERGYDRLCVGSGHRYECGGCFPKG